MHGIKAFLTMLRVSTREEEHFSMLNWGWCGEWDGCWCGYRGISDVSHSQTQSPISFGLVGPLGSGIKLFSVEIAYPAYTVFCTYRIGSGKGWN